MPLFLLIRHGENELMKQGRLACRMPGIHLNDTGRSQAQAVAKALAQIRTQASAGPAHNKPAKKRKDKPGKQPEDKEAKKPEEQPVWKLYSSPMERAVETAEPIAQALGLDGEPARVATQVEHVGIVAQPRETQPVIALVAEQAGLVARFHVHAVTKAVLADGQANG